MAGLHARLLTAYRWATLAGLISRDGLLSFQPPATFRIAETVAHSGIGALRYCLPEHTKTLRPLLTICARHISVDDRSRCAMPFVERNIQI